MVRLTSINCVQFRFGFTEVSYCKSIASIIFITICKNKRCHVRYKTKPWLCQFQSRVRLSVCNPIGNSLSAILNIYSTDGNSVKSRKFVKLISLSYINCTLVALCKFTQALLILAAIEQHHGLNITFPGDNLAFTAMRPARAIGIVLGGFLFPVLKSRSLL